MSFMLFGSYSWEGTLVWQIFLKPAFTSFILAFSAINIIINNFINIGSLQITNFQLFILLLFIFLFKGRNSDLWPHYEPKPSIAQRLIFENFIVKQTLIEKFYNKNDWLKTIQLFLSKKNIILSINILLHYMLRFII